MSDLPVTSLLSQVLIALTIETDNEAESRIPHFISDDKTKPWSGVWLTSYAMHANFLRFVGDKGVRMGDLAAMAGYAPPVHPAYHGMRRWGYVTFTPDIDGSNPKAIDADALVKTTSDGAAARDTWNAVIKEMQRRWSARGLGQLQAALITIASEIERPLPEYLPTLGFDRSQPPLGSPVSRPAIELDLLGLLSQVLLAMTYDFESQSEVPLATLGGLLEPLTDAPVPTRGLYELTGVATKEWSSAMNQLTKAGLTSLGTMEGTKTKAIALTDAGVAAKEAGTELLRQIEARWRKDIGLPMEKLRNELVRVVDDAWGWTDPYPDGWRAKTRLPRRLAHHPVVSHRGGYPDGS